MIRHGSAPYLECSSRGDKRFSAFYAKVYFKDTSGTIEEIYQAAKVFDDGCTGLSWRQAKRRKAVNMEECHRLYHFLWKTYLMQNKELINILRAASGLSDMFGQPGHCCQATELWTLRNDKDFLSSAA